MRRIINVVLFAAALNGVLCGSAQIAADTTQARLYDRDSVAIASAIPDRVNLDDLKAFGKKMREDHVITREEDEIYTEMLRRCELPPNMRMAPASVFVDTVTIVDPYLVEDNDVYFLIDAKDLDFEKPRQSLRDKPCFATFLHGDIADVVFTLPAKLNVSLIDRNLLYIDDNVNVELYKKSRRGNIYHFTENVTKFLITLVQISELNRRFDVHYDFEGKAPKNLPHPFIKNGMPYSQYMLVATPLISDKGK